MKLINNDCIAAMKEMPDNSVDSIVTDPPYELGFMGKSWDSTGIAFNIEVWQEALRVLKPGGHLLAFSGSRTYHRMAVAIEDAGFEIRDQIMWIYGSGFPKSLDVSKAIDKSAGAPVKIGKAFKVAGEYGGRNLRDCDPQGIQREEMRHQAITDSAKQWQGWGTALKPAHEPIVVARKPLIGTVAANVLTFGTGGLNIDGSRVEGEVPSVPMAEWTRSGTTGATDQRNGEMSQPNSLGRWPANVIHDGSDEVVALFPSNVKGQVGMKKDVGDFRFITGDTETVQKFNYGTTDSGSAARFFYCAKTSKRDRNEGLDGFEVKGKVFNGQSSSPAGNAEGSVEDKFSTSPSANHHPTVKPTDLMRYLVKLVTPPKGIVLDPFMGSGSTGKGAVLEGFDFIGIEMSAEYLEIAKARIAYAQDEGSK
jgi:site-specific DNA-methyltransferase (adenine-specific)